MNNPLKFLFVLSFIGTACSNNANENELLKLRKENVELKKKISAFDEAIVLTSENIGEYVTAVSFSQFKGKRNEEIQHYTSLVLNKVPKHVEVEWESSPEPMSLKEDGITRYSNNTYEKAGVKKFKGSYTLIFPGGKKWSIPWEREYSIE